MYVEHIKTFTVNLGKQWGLYMVPFNPGNCWRKKTAEKL